jgi:hypothetical protein
VAKGGHCESKNQTCGFGDFAVANAGSFTDIPVEITTTKERIGR